MKALFGIVWIAMSVTWAQTPTPTTAETPMTSSSSTTTTTLSETKAGKGKEISAVVRIIRANPETEVFFKDYKDSLIIPKDSQHNKIFAACEESRKKGTSVKLVVDPVGRRILGLPETAPAGENGDSGSAVGGAGSH